MANKYEKAVKELLALASIEVSGSNPWDIKVNDERFYRRLLSDGPLGLGESYMDGWWDCERVDEFIDRVIRAELGPKIEKNWEYALFVLESRIFNLQNTKKAFEVGERHYDLGNDLYQSMLDKRMAYSCGYWRNAKNLDEAQEAKLDLICKKIGLVPGMKVLDIGCGWGSFAKYAAEKYKVDVVGVTISKEQLELSREMCKGLPVELCLRDYRDLKDTYDRVISIGMFEHVGFKNYRKFMETVDSCLKNDGIFLLHTVGGNLCASAGDPWVAKYIFPNGMLPSIAQIGRSIQDIFVMEDWHNFGEDYDKTLLAWQEKFVNNWQYLKTRYNDRFYRMWTYYLLSFAGVFRARNLQLWQIVMTKHGRKQPDCRIG